MRISVDWMEKWGNDPQFVVESLDLPKYPSATDPVWENRDGIHVAVLNPVVYYFYTDGKPCRGFAGRKFQGTFVNGDTFEYVGAWSSRASCVNERFPAFKIVDVTVGHTATAISADALIHWWECNDTNWGLAWVTEANGETRLMPTRNGALKNPARPTDTVEHLSK